MDDLKAELAAQEWAGGALVRESERLRELLDHAEIVNGELATEREQLRAEIEWLRAALQQIANEAQYPAGMTGAAFLHLDRIYEIVNEALEVPKAS